MHRLKELWGDDAEDFRPERWVGRKPGWEYLPFNGGPRICLGREYSISTSNAPNLPSLSNPRLLVVLRGHATSDSLPHEPLAMAQMADFCPTEQFALTEASYVLVRLLQRFDGIENLDHVKTATHNLTLTSCPGNGVKVRLHAAAE